VVKVDFDPEMISYKELLKVFFAVHDPTTLNRQGNDIGPQYRSIILTASEEQKKAATEFIAELNQEIGGGIVTEVKPLAEFYEAEEYHHNYFNRNPNAGYCQVIIAPKVAKLRKEYAEMVKEK
jgi:peptide-methionine (S)-S-oxide reductase